MNWEEFERLTEGSKIRDEDGEEYLKIEQREDLHLYGGVVCLSNGKIKHVSWLKCFRLNPPK